MSDKSKRIDELAKAVGALGKDDGENALPIAIQQARSDGTLLSGGSPATVTLDELNAVVAALEAVKTVEQKRELQLARARIRAGVYAGSPAELWRAQRRAEALLGPLPPVESDAP